MAAGDLSRLITYDAWANEEAVGSIVAARNPPARVSALMGHIVGAEWLWWARVHASAPRHAVWPTLSTEQMAEEVRELGSAWGAHVAAADPAALGARVAYTNSKGEGWSSTVGDIVLHVVLHSAYHRGQVAQLLRGAGAEPAYTDFIHAVRTAAIGD